MFTIQSILDLDLYKLTVQQIVFHRFSNINVSYEFKCRNIKMPDGSKVSSDMLFKYVSLDMVEEEIEKLNELALTNDEYEYLESLDYFEPTYLSFLKNFRFDTKKDLEIYPVNKDQWAIKATGPWVQVILYETMILSIVNNLFAHNFAHTEKLNHDPLEYGEGLIKENINRIDHTNAFCEKWEKPFQLVEFGTRRRASSSWQSLVLNYLLQHIPYNLAGTSNVHFARTKGLKAIGTFGHEFPMGMQGIHPIQHSAREAYKYWIREYRGLWGICLPDTLGHNKFFKDFSYELAKAYDGVRHDSGNPYEFGEKIIQMYKGYGIDPKSKSIVFSDGLDIENAIRIWKYFKGKINTSFGIGTYLTHSIGTPVPSIVMKIAKSHGQPVIKLCDDVGKVSCTDDLYREYAIRAINNY